MNLHDTEVRKYFLRQGIDVENQYKNFFADFATNLAAFEAEQVQ